MAGSKIRLYGSTSGYVELAAPAVADDAVLTLPTGTGGFGKTLQVVQTVKTDTFTTTSTSFVDVTGLTVTMTPSSDTSKILISFSINVSQDNASDGALMVLLTDGSNNALLQGDAAGSRSRATYGFRVPSQTQMLYNAAGSFLWSPATTSAVTVKLRLQRLVLGTAVVNRLGNDADSANGFPRTASTLTAIEVAA